MDLQHPLPFDLSEPHPGVAWLELNRPAQMNTLTPAFFEQLRGAVQALDLARRIAAKSPLAGAGSKLALNHAVDHPRADALQHMALLQSAIRDLDEMQAAIAAWKGRRDAEFAPLTPAMAAPPPAR
jgi:enoyl-CoA hydratase/carnithine racemase